jgi:dTDP-glucose 4,6-dehydratase
MLKRSKSLLVTGGAGFIGSHFVEEVLDDQDSPFQRVVVLDLLTYSGLRSNVETFVHNPKFKFVQGDIADRKLVESILNAYAIDSIVNFAAESHVDRSISAATPFVHTNVEGVTNLLECFRDSCNGRFIQISTDEVYGSIREGSWRESEPLAPNSPYSASKASADLMALAFHRTYGVDLCITRCSNNYGPRQFPEKLIPLFITNLIDGQKLPLYGDGKNVRDWIHVKDHCRAVLRVINQGQSGSVYNIGGHHEVSNLELTTKLLWEFDAPENSIDYVKDRVGHDFRYSVDDSKIRTELAFENLVVFEAGLRDTIHWYKTHEWWWRDLK